MARRLIEQKLAIGFASTGFKCQTKPKYSGPCLLYVTFQSARFMN